MAIFGLFVGIAFGFLLQKGEVIRYDRQIGAMLFKDMTIFKFMMSAMLIGMIGLYLAQGIGLVEIINEPFSWVGVIVGGLIFGIGWGLVGYCPGTAGGALGEGNLDALSAIGGLIVGSTTYAALFPVMQPLYDQSIAGNLGLPTMLNVHPSIIIAGIAVFYIAIFKWWEKNKL